MQKKTKPKSHLKVVLDTNALYVPSHGVGSVADLVRQDVADLITAEKHPDLDISWYLPEIVRHERQYQMRTEAQKLRPAIDKIERLLAHKLALTDDALFERVNSAINQTISALGIKEIALDHTAVEWKNVIHAAAYRHPPFQPGEKEKGFRDALVLESFCQVIRDSPKTPAVCRIVLVTSDNLLIKAAQTRIEDLANTRIVSNIEDLRGFINTLVSNAGEDFISALQPKASKLFFTSSQDKDCLFYRFGIREKLESRFSAELKQRPEGTSFRTDETWRIAAANFVKKEGRRISWASRIEIEVKVGIQEPAKTIVSSNAPKEAASEFSPSVIYTSYLEGLGPQFPTESLGSYLPMGGLGGLPMYQPSNRPLSIGSLMGAFGTSKVVTQEGRDVYEVLWSVEVTSARTFKKALFGDIKHVGLSLEPTTGS